MVSSFAIIWNCSKVSGTEIIFIANIIGIIILANIDNTGTALTDIYRLDENKL